MSTTTDTRPLSNVPLAGPPPRRRGRPAALIVGGVLTFALIGWAIFALVTLTSWQTADGSKDFVGPVKRVVVHASAGGVTITGTPPADSHTARASWHSRWYFFRPSVHATLDSDGTLTVNTACRQQWQPISCNVQLGLGVPPGVPVNVSSSGGGVTASHLTGGMVVSSSGGGVHLEHIAGSVRVTSSGGSVNLSFSTPPQNVHVRSSGGGVRVALPEVAGNYRISASSSGGSVHVDIPNNDRSTRLVDVASSGGGVRVTSPAS